MHELVRQIEAALEIAVCAAPIMRYQALLQRLPTPILRTVCAIQSADENAGAVIIYIAGRIGWVLHGVESALFDEDETKGGEVLALAGHNIARDCARELLRREGYLQKFKPRPDPFGVMWLERQTKCEMSLKGLELTGNRKRLLQEACEDKD